MKVRRAASVICIEFTFAEALVFLEELSNVRGGARLPKLRQVCRGLEIGLRVTPNSSTAEQKYGEKS